MIIKEKICTFLYSMGFTLIIILFIFGMAYVNSEVETAGIAETNPIAVLELNENSFDMALFGKGISIERKAVDKAILTVERYGYLIPPEYLLILQILKMLKT